MLLLQFLAVSGTDMRVTTHHFLSCERSKVEHMNPVVSTGSALPLNLYIFLSSENPLHLIFFCFQAAYCAAVATEGPKVLGTPCGCLN